MVYTVRIPGFDCTILIFQGETCEWWLSASRIPPDCLSIRRFSFDSAMALYGNQLMKVTLGNKSFLMSGSLHSIFTPIAPIAHISSQLPKSSGTPRMQARHGTISKHPSFRIPSACKCFISILSMTTISFGPETKAVLLDLNRDVMLKRGIQRTTAGNGT